MRGFLESLLSGSEDVSSSLKAVDTSKFMDYSVSLGEVSYLAEEASTSINYDERGGMSLRSTRAMMDASAERNLQKKFGDLLFGEDRRKRTNPKHIQGDYQKIGAATIGAGLAMAKVDEAGDTPNSPAYGEFFSEIVGDGEIWNVNPDVIEDFPENIDEYAEIVQESAEKVEQGLIHMQDPDRDIEKLLESEEANKAERN